MKRISRKERVLSVGLGVMIFVGLGLSALAADEPPKPPTATPTPQTTPAQPPSPTPELPSTPGPVAKEPVRTTVDRATIDGYLRSWDTRPAQVAKEMIDQYGLPDEATPSMIIWLHNGPWLKTIVHREPVNHNFPKPHTDVVEQFIELKVPAARADDVIAFDGSVTIRRTEGVVSARCDNEAMNFLAINLTHDIATTALTPKQARAKYAKIVQGVLAGDRDPYTEGIAFERSDKAAPDPDAAVIK